MLSKKMETALNEQIVREFAAEQLYLSMASWCETNKLPGVASFFYRQSREEREHMLKLVRYINKTDGVAEVPACKAPQKAFKSLLETMELSLAGERAVSKAINALVDMSLTIKDYQSFNFLQWYVSEQHEEEALFTDVIDMIKLFSKDEKGLFFLDREIPKIGQNSDQIEKV
ncbi:MAG: ferritin [Deltaproteobacteria bacterium CG11_big_fil_rev_8_21_14_0_20_47_16]|nr:MAG: ferritin [Deltaproteobacteria bacterium CG11_big_fil_rev_8_21_14_0_20_47_16]